MYVKARYTHILSHPFQFTIHLLQSLSPTDAHSKGHVPSHCAVRAWSRSRWLIVSKLSWRGHLQLALLGFWILSINPPLIHSAVLLTLTAVCSKSAILSSFIFHSFVWTPLQEKSGRGVCKAPRVTGPELALLPSLKDRLWFFLFSFNL